MSLKTQFRRLRQAFAPMLRPVLEHVAPVRGFAGAVLARRQPAQVQVDGLVYDVHPGDFGVTLELTSAGAYEPGSLQVMLERLPEGGCFVDIGAHVGLFTLPAARRVGPGGKVFAFEPNPANRALLEANVQRNGFADVVEIIPAAVSAAAGRAVLHCCAWNTGDHRLLGAPSGRKGVEVDVVALGDFLAEREMHADVIKVDVQGAEVQVLEGLGTPDPLPALLLEYSPSMVVDAGDDPERLLAMMESAGWLLAMVDEDTGALTHGDAAAVRKACPHQSYVNLLAEVTRA